MKKILAAFALAGVVGAMLPAAASANYDSSINVLINSGFELGTYNSWTRVRGPLDGRFDAVATDGSFGVPAKEGTRLAGAASSYDKSKDQSYIYQQFYAPAGDVRVAGWGYAWNAHPGGADPADTYILIGWDPLGGTDASAASVVWSNPINATNQWEQREIFGVSPGGTNTVFAKVFHNWPIEWNVTYVDAFEANVVPEPASLLALASGLAGMAGVALRRRS